MLKILSKYIVLVAILLISLVLLVTYFIAKDNAQIRLQQDLKTHLLQVVNKLEITLEKHEYLPSLLATDLKIKKFLKADRTMRFNDQLSINLFLERTKNTSESSAIYIMAADGTTIASSNWESKRSFIGKNFSFRPYFQQALHNTLGRYYAVGTVSGERGYFFASSIKDDGKVIGVVVVKVAIEDIEFTWGQGVFDFMVTDLDGVIFLSSQKDWRLHTLVEIPEAKHKQLIASRRYGSGKLIPLHETALNLALNNYQSIQLLGQSYEMLSHDMKRVNWHVSVVSKYRDIQNVVITSLLIMAVILLLLIALALALWKAQKQRKKYQQHITEALEKKVLQRTKALKQSQEDLIQAAKMAALGQLSAGITHEINNPLTAIRAYADNATQFLEQDRLDMVLSNLTEIINLTESMAAITKQLKSFSRKSKGQMRPVLLEQSITKALTLVTPRLKKRNITCHWDEGDGVQNSILADELWLGQIVVNLLTNAISAVQNSTTPEIWIRIKKPNASLLCIQVEDNGSGIEESALPRIFEPFFTTKPSSKGLGLGLSISFNLAKDMNGSLQASNLTKGAQFSLCLPKADELSK